MVTIAGSGTESMDGELSQKAAIGTLADLSLNLGPMSVEGQPFGPWGSVPEAEIEVGRRRNSPPKSGNMTPTTPISPTRQTHAMLNSAFEQAQRDSAREKQEIQKGVFTQQALKLQEVAKALEASKEESKELARRLEEAKNAMGQTEEVCAQYRQDLAVKDEELQRVKESNGLLQMDMEEDRRKQEQYYKILVESHGQSETMENMLDQCRVDLEKVASLKEALRDVKEESGTIIRALRQEVEAQRANYLSLQHVSSEQ
ncbi:hypothetical protein CYMTET_15547, partial [Cymbomonas tetramitiformis]